jgi:hypothetical protein
MKFLKIKIIKNKKYLKKDHSLFQLETLKNKENIIIGNIIRRNLLSKSMRTIFNN